MQGIIYLKSLEKFGINFGLQKINLLLSRLGKPQNQFKSIHIAGTNGKGSTAAMLASILKEAGYKVGLYTSPHLLDWRERIQINGQLISKNDFEEGIARIKKLTIHPSNHLPVRQTSLTIFEVLTALAFWYFAKEKVDYAIVEVGMGGRLDATNVITPLVSIITNIDLEHREVLGRTLTKIAKEKAGIIKPGVPVVTAETKAKPLKVIKQVCRIKNSPLSMVHCPLSKHKLYLKGPHQKLNAACALTAIKLAKIPVTKKAIKKGLLKTNWPGRLQVLSKRPLIIVDGAHNPAGIKALVVTIKKLYQNKRFTVIFGCQKTKQHQIMLQYLKPILKQLIITRSSNPQAAAEQNLCQNRKNNSSSICLAKSYVQAIKRWDRKSPLLITGSLFLVADALKSNCTLTV